MHELDEALERFQIGDVEYAGGLSNHGPMAAEALQALGHPSLIPALVDIYAPRLPTLQPGRAIPRVERTAALGVRGRTPDWIASFEADLLAAPWREVLRAELPALLPGLFAAACHGLLRVAHAVRALEREETPQRRRELAYGLGYWAGHYCVLPGEPGSGPVSGCGPGEILRELVVVDPTRRRPGLFSEGVGVLAERAEFAAAVARLDLAELDLDAFVGRLCLASAALYLAHPEARIAYVHCVTAPSALRILAPHLAPADRGRAAGHALQSVAALHAISGRAGAEIAPLSAEAAAIAGSPAEIRYRAACSVEEHAIKMTEACLREDAIHPDPLLRAAAADAALSIGVSRGGRGG